MFSQIALMGNNKVFFSFKQNRGTLYLSRGDTDTGQTDNIFMIWISSFVICYRLLVSQSHWPLTSPHLTSRWAIKTMETIRVTGRGGKFTLHTTKLQAAGWGVGSGDQLSVSVLYSARWSFRLATGEKYNNFDKWETLVTQLITRRLQSQTYTDISIFVANSPILAMN